MLAHCSDGKCGRPDIVHITSRVLIALMVSVVATCVVRTIKFHPFDYSSRVLAGCSQCWYDQKPVYTEHLG